MSSRSQITGTLICEGREHTITWCDGAVVLDHHDDPVGELALCALGATWPSCIAVLAAVRRRFDPVGTWPVWTGPLPRASGPELMLKAWRDLQAARPSAAPEDGALTVEGAEDRWAMTTLGLLEPALRRRLALDAVIGRCRRSGSAPVQPFGVGGTRRGFSRRDGRGPLAESLLLASVGAPPGASLRWLLEDAGDRRAGRLRDAPVA